MRPILSINNIILPYPIIKITSNWLLKLRLNKILISTPPQQELVNCNFERKKNYQYL